MKKLLFALYVASVAWFPLEAAESVSDASHIDVYVTPYYNSKGPSVTIGRFSSGLASAKKDEFLATITRMKKDWEQLTFPELYVAAIRLYDLGYRKEAVYWFYSAQYRGRQFGILLDQSKMGSIGSPGFELLQAQNAFFQLVGPYINGYAFGDMDGLVKVVERVQKEGRRIPDLQTTYPNVAFRSKSEWEPANTDLADGMGKLISTLKEKKDDIRRQRIQQGIEEKFSKLTNKELTGQ
ncbi:MAG: hypothetical protein DMG89_11635 [Acidobacteria bacterium]|nr:MAG: hypothetical protein DMG89_11635 [Acidobacteriota bacterium]